MPRMPERPDVVNQTAAPCGDVRIEDLNALGLESWDGTTKQDPEAPTSKTSTLLTLSDVLHMDPAGRQSRIASVSETPSSPTQS